MTEDKDLDELANAEEQIIEIARRFGLDPFPVFFELVTSYKMYEDAAYGLPARFNHWTRGKAFYRMKTQYDYGLSKIYEVIFNTNPAVAYLMEQNDLLQNKVVIAHVMGHSDFFKNNAYFQHTSRRMIEKVGIHADRIHKYEFDHGEQEVERFLDAVLSIEEHIDPNAFSRRRPDKQEEPAKPGSGPYDDLWDLEKRNSIFLEDDEEEEYFHKPRKFPPEPEKDILRFLAEHAPDLEEWQRDIIMIVREEMLYFLPQMQTKTLNEGWASYWHARTMREMELTDAEAASFAQMHAGVLAPSRTHLNPYHLGYKILEDIEHRWDHPTKEEQERLGRKPGQGRAKLFEVRELENDVSFLRNYLTKDLVADLDLYIYKKEGDEWVIVEKDWEKVRDSIVASMTNFGYPYLVIEDADYHRNSELYLKHYFEGQELDLVYGEKTLQYVYQLWGRPVHLETLYDGRRVLLSYDGDKNQRINLDKERG
ncbi:MAG TPA: SpoVR family protein [Ktedonobacterales bacterium]|nr:SpoVR family protein [Ktedonobacterales bacterium]